MPLVRSAQLIDDLYGLEVSPATLLARIEHADEVLHFVTDLRLPFIKNLGERAIRLPKVKQKIFGCFRTFNGAENFCIIRSYLDTIHKQDHNTFELLRHAFIGNPLRLPHAELSLFIFMFRNRTPVLCARQMIKI